MQISERENNVLFLYVYVKKGHVFVQTWKQRTQRVVCVCDVCVTKWHVFVQIFEEEHNVWFLDKGGALVAVKQPSVPTRHLW